MTIIGAGPAGLGAAWRLLELGFDNFRIYEKAPFAGGLSSSFLDPKGFTWDVGGHVLFSHYEYFDRLMDSLLGEAWVNHERESWIWIANRFVPYPFQYNIGRLPEELVDECLRGLEEVQQGGKEKPAHFKEWILIGFGEGIARVFMLPYNFKVWACPPEEMSYNWIGERVAEVDLARLRSNIENRRDDISWGPNSTFRFPRHGGTGEIWRRLADRIG
ncbi:MAG: NAD(P)-binding protein, partial [Planctomycetes bacterium]|nr:NAD(P)-binding protein [Planctomycetota bacterium]